MAERTLIEAGHLELLEWVHKYCEVPKSAKIRRVNIDAGYDQPTVVDIQFVLADSGLIVNLKEQQQ